MLTPGTDTWERRKTEAQDEWTGLRPTRELFDGGSQGRGDVGELVSRDRVEHRDGTIALHRPQVLGSNSRCLGDLFHGEVRVSGPPACHPALARGCRPLLPSGVKGLPRSCEIALDGASPSPRTPRSSPRYSRPTASSATAELVRTPSASRRPGLRPRFPASPANAVRCPPMFSGLLGRNASWTALLARREPARRGIQAEDPGPRHYLLNVTHDAKLGARSGLLQRLDAPGRRARDRLNARADLHHLALQFAPSLVIKEHRAR